MFSYINDVLHVIYSIRVFCRSVDAVVNAIVLELLDLMQYVICIAPT